MATTRPPQNRTPQGKSPSPRTPQKNTRQKKQKKASCLTYLTGFVILSTVLVLTLLFIIVSTISKYTQQLPDLRQVAIPDLSETTKVYDSNGIIIAELYIENREFVQYNEIPDTVKLAIIATEDERFFRHKGFDAEGFARAMFVALKTKGKVRQGASTITQQLTRGIFLTREKTVIRKIKEIILALALEKKYSKEEIFTYYLNNNYWGAGAHGIKTASKIYFGKNLKDIELHEAALLAAILKSTTYYNPYFYPDKALSRRNYVVLAKMRDLKFISEGEYQNAIRQPIKIEKRTGPGYENYKAPYFVTYLLDYMQDKDRFEFPIESSALYTKGYQIHTTIDLSLNQYAEDAVKYGIELAKQRNTTITQGALVAIEPQTGRILSMVGGVDYKTSKFNRAWQALRQPGSSFKPFIYITALKQGMSMSNTIHDGRVCYGHGPQTYCPNNFDNKFRGTMTFRSALIRSQNVPAVKIAKMVGISNVIQTVRDMGISTPLSPNLSLALGSGEVTVIDMATAYAIIANGGRLVKPVAVDRIEDSRGVILYRHKTNLLAQPVVLDPTIVEQIIPALQAVIQHGTGIKANIGRPAGGKTGTTSDFRDTWFCGFTPQIATAVWFGNDNNLPLRALIDGKPRGKGITGGTIPAPAWAYYMSRALDGKETLGFDFKPIPGYKSATATALPAENFDESSPQPSTRKPATPHTTDHLENSRPYNYIEPETTDFSKKTRTPPRRQREEEDLRFLNQDNTGPISDDNLF